MQLKTFRGNSMAAALCAVKKELGKDAVIVHTRTFKVGGVMGVGAKEVVEVIAAIENEVAGSRYRAVKSSAAPAAHQINLSRRAQALGQDARPDKRPRSIASPAEGLRPCGSDRTTPAREVGHSNNNRLPEASAPHIMQVRKRLSIEPIGGSDTQAASLSHTPPREQRMTDSRSHTTRLLLPTQTPSRSMQDAVSLVIDGPSCIVPHDSRDSLATELNVIKSMLGELMQSKAGPAATIAAGRPADVSEKVHASVDKACAGPLAEHYLRLISHHVSRELAERIIGAVRDELSPRRQASPAIVREAVLRHLSELVPTSDTSLAPTRNECVGLDGKPFTIALVGPTGVGKTTTIAKLAAAYQLRQGRRVGLITTDTYRVGAVEQLSTYAGMIGVPLKVASNPDEMQAACDELSDMDVVLIDTAGRSPRDGERLNELHTLLQAGAPDETHLVLSSTASESAMLEAANRFGTVGTSRVIFTKLDEAVTFGVIFNVAQQIGTQLSFITTGQEVPDQIEATRPERLARLMLGSL